LASQKTQSARIYIRLRAIIKDEKYFLTWL